MRDMTPEEAERAFDEAPAIPMSEKEIDGIVLRVLLMEKVNKVLDDNTLPSGTISHMQAAERDGYDGATWMRGWFNAHDDLRKKLERAILRPDNGWCWVKADKVDWEWWWWWDGSDSPPVPVYVMRSGTDGTFFAPHGQHGWTRAQNVTDMGGWWMRLKEPPTPHEPEPDGT